MKLLIENYRTIIVIILDLNKKRKEKFLKSILLTLTFYFVQRTRSTLDLNEKYG